MDAQTESRAKDRRLDWHQLDVSQAVARLTSNQQVGLGSEQARARLDEFGTNEIVETGQRTWPGILFGQLKSSLVVLLAIAVVISLILGEYTDAFAILAIIVLNTLLGFWQDFQAEKSLAELRKLSVPEVTVRRNGNAINMPAAQIVPGDIVILKPGFLVPSDCRLLAVSELAVDESALTGESLPVDKTVLPIEKAELSIGDRTNMAFMGTMVTRGRGEAIVAETGMKTELGEIAGSLQAVQSEPTPLQIKLRQLGRTLAVIAIAVVCLVFIAGLMGGQPPRLMLLTALSLAVAIVPEGLPAVATVALALGARQMFRKNALIRRLPAVETLGSVSVICSDKTGTLTQNKMTATILDVANCRVNMTDVSRMSNERRTLWLSDNPSIQLLLLAGCLCNDAQLQQVDGESCIIGEPTEKALVEVAATCGLQQPELHAAFPRIGEIAFDSERKRMTTVHDQIAGQNLLATRAIFPGEQETGPVAFIKGAVEALLQITKDVSVDGKAEPIDDQWRSRIRRSHDELASQGTRVLAVGFRRPSTNDPIAEIEQAITFVGLVGLTDPPRPEAKSAVQLCRQAGIRPVMITGDHPLTAMSIARQLGIVGDQAGGGAVAQEETIIGQQLSNMPPDVLREKVKHVSVFARVAPADKLHIVEALQANHEVVAMTGDGVNDAPALKQASIGVAMGETGTDVARQAANMVLLDDNFATIVTAVQQGRRVYNNIHKFVKYAMSGNIGEVLVMTIGVIFGMPLPLLPLQILWVNLVTDGLPGLALAVEPVEKNTMDRPPLPADEPIFNRSMIWDLLWIGIWICAASLLTASIFWNESGGVVHWRTIIFTVLTLTQMANAFACRSEGPVLFSKRQFQNMWLWAAVASTFLLQLAVIYWPPMQTIFQTTALSFFEFGACCGASLIVFLMIESRKSWIDRRQHGTSAKA